MFRTEAEASPHVEALQTREANIGMHVRLLDLLPDPVLKSRSVPLVSLKTLYSDFVVRELSPFYNNGEPLQLTALPVSSQPDGQKKKKSANGEGAADGKRPREEDGDSNAVGKELIEKFQQALDGVLAEEDMTRLVSGLASGEQKIVLGKIEDKAKRTQLHQAVKSCIGATHISGTDNGIIFVSRATAADRKEEKRRSNPISKRKFLHFTLYKENLDSNQVFRSLAKHLHLSTRQFQFCGTKDKRAVTLQRVAIRDMDADRLARVNDSSFGGQGVVKVADFVEMEEGLRLGDANGNHFRIVLRLHPCVTAPTDAQLRCTEKALQQLGAVNYFGPQRFGTTEVLTSDVGIEILKGDFRAALQLVFASKACIVPDMKEVLPLLEKQLYTEALQNTLYFCFQERDMLKHLVAHPHDYLGAFQTIPRTMAMLYCHAVQSLVWNKMVSRRLSGGRINPEVGDLVLESVYKTRVQSKDPSANIVSTDLDTKDVLPAVRYLADGDDLSLFALADVLLTVPGPDTELQFPKSTGCTRAEYEEEMKLLGVAEALLDADASSKLVKVFHYHGTYRALCIRPTSVRLTQSAVDSWRSPVIPTDWEALRNTAEPSSAPTAPGVSPEEAVPLSVIVAEFSLAPGCYATSVLREFSTACSENFHGKGEEKEAEE